MTKFSTYKYNIINISKFGWIHIRIKQFDQYQLIWSTYALNIFIDNSKFSDACIEQICQQWHV